VLEPVFVRPSKLAGGIELPPEVAELVRGSKSRATLKSYDSQWANFVAWCWAKDLECLPAEPATVATHLASMVKANKGASSLRSRLAAIGYVHQMSGHAKPIGHALVQATLQGAVRATGEEVSRAAPMTLEILREACTRMFDPHTFVGRRDRALLLVGWAAALRRSEIVALKVEDLTFLGMDGDGGMIVRVRSSKTDQTRKGASIFVPCASSTLICPVRAAKWVNKDARVGTLFVRQDRHGNRLGGLTPGFVNLTVKRAVALTGRDPRGFSGHSLRAGFVTSMRANGVPEHLIARQTRHTDLRMLGVYDRPEDLTRPGASALSGAEWW
jgi:site-specific recombinase XerD